MRIPLVERRDCARSLWSLIIVFAVALGDAQPARAQNALDLFKNYFVTGDYAVAGVGMRGTGVLDPVTQEKWATATITLGGVPANGDILAAFLYWAALETTSAPFSANGFFNGLPIVGKSLGPAGGNSGVNGCWGSGGGSGTTSGASPLRVYRANVLAALPFPKDANGVPVGKRQANGSHVVKLRDSGGGGTQVPQSGNQKNLIEGASLVVVWRRPDYPLRGVSIYDGAYTANQDNNGVMNQVVKGFYQAAAGDDARMTHIVSNGNTNFEDRLTVGVGDDEVVPGGVSPTNAFTGAQGFSWDNLTFDVSLDDDAFSITTAVESVGSAVDCLSWSTILFSTRVKDSDWDGLLDVWETVGLRDLDNAGPTLVDLPGMGANPDVQDIFIQVAYLKTTGQTTYGPDPPGPTPPITAPAHSHLPSKAILDQIVTLFESAAPRRNPAGNPLETCLLPSEDCISGPIRVHFDVGSTPGYTGPCSTSGPCPYVPQSLADGGHSLLESQVSSSQFPLWPGTIGWKSGYLKIWDELLSPANNPAFDPNRRHIFRRALFGHAIAIQDPLKPAGTPRSVSGVADAGNGGGDFMVTLGLWDNFTGTQFVQNSTTVHEMAHLFGIRHGGAAPQPGVPSLNCKPNYQSITNYLFQVLGLPGPTGPIIDLSRQVLLPLDENSLAEAPLTDIGEPAADMMYPTRWYVPVDLLGSGNLNVTVGTTPAAKTCTGAIVPPGEQTMIRVSGTSATDAIDWNFDGTVGGTVSQDVNYNENPEQLDTTLEGYNDWLNLDLRQGASRRNRSPGDVTIGSVEVPIAWSLEIDKDDVASGDPGFGDPGFGDPGFGDPGFGDPGFGDPGFGDPGFGDPGFGDPGFGDPGFGGDLDFERATDLGGSPFGLGFTTTNQAIVLKWCVPTAGKVSKYRIWRATGPITELNQPIKIAEPPPNTPITSSNCPDGKAQTFSDTTSKKNVDYSYVVSAVVEAKNSGPSNILFPARR